MLFAACVCRKKEIEDKDMDRLWEQHQKLAPRVLTTKRVVAKKADVPAA